MGKPINFIIYQLKINTILYQQQNTRQMFILIVNQLNQISNNILKYYRLNKVMKTSKETKKKHKNNIIVIDSDSQMEIFGHPYKMVKTDKNQTLNSNPYQNILQIPEIKLTLDQMKADPIQLLIFLQKKYEQFGAVKLVACEAWNCFFAFGNVDRPLTVRVQTLQQLKQGKPFQQKVKSLRINEYKQNALNFSKNYKFKTSPTGKTLEAKHEQQYWNLISKRQYQHDKVTVEYAADLPVSLYGSGFPTRKIHTWKDSDFEYQNNLFNLNNIYKSPLSMLRISERRRQKISGISSPWMYVGMLFSTFCWHVQDLYINSLNYNHHGQTKTWYVIPKAYKQEFERYVKNRYETNGKKKHLLEKITLMIDPIQLIKAGIKVYKVNQRPREYVFTFFKAYHCGFSHGFNIGEAVNFISYQSLPYIKEAYRFYEEQYAKEKRKMKLYVIPYDWLILENITQKLPIPAQYQERVQKQYRRITNREFLFIKSTVDQYGQFIDIKIIEGNKKYESNFCSYCKNYIYLTSMQCLNCNKNLCERHIEQCECKDKKWKLLIRQLSEDRIKIRNIVSQLKQKIFE